jgi:hypothetical protein
MLDRFTFRSRPGNIALGLAGVLYTPLGLVVLALYVRQCWGASSLVDFVLQLGMGGAAAMGAFFVHVATHNLGGRLRLRRP